jgi:hypothetical protein
MTVGLSADSRRPRKAGRALRARSTGGPKGAIRLRPDLARVPPEAHGPHLDVGPYLGRKVSFASALRLARQLIDGRLRAMPPGVRRALAMLEDATVRSFAAIELMESQAQASVARGRAAALTSTTRVTSMLRMWAKAPGSSIAVRHSSLLSEIFGPSRAAYQRLSPHDLFVRLDIVRQKLKRQPRLRRRLEAAVHVANVDALLDGVRRLEIALGTDERPASPPDVRGLLIHLNRCIDHYAVCVAATATPGDESAVRKATAALRPILELRKASLRRPDRRPRARRRSK